MKKQKSVCVMYVYTYKYVYAIISVNTSTFWPRKLVIAGITENADSQRSSKTNIGGTANLLHRRY